MHWSALPMFDKLLPVLMYALLFAVLALAAVGMIALANLALGVFGASPVDLSWINILLVAVLMRILLIFAK